MFDFHKLLSDYSFFNDFIVGFLVCMSLIESHVNSISKIQYEREGFDIPRLTGQFVIDRFCTFLI